MSRPDYIANAAYQIASNHVHPDQLPARLANLAHATMEFITDECALRDLHFNGMDPAYTLEVEIFKFLCHSNDVDMAGLAFDLDDGEVIE